MLILVCSVRGMNNIDTEITFYGPNELERPCPDSKTHAYQFPDGTTTRFNQTCILNIFRATQAYSGKYICQIHPVQDDTCHDLTNSTSVWIRPDNSSHTDNNALQIALGVGGGVVITGAVCFCLGLTIRCCCCKRGNSRGLSSKNKCIALFLCSVSSPSYLCSSRRRRC